MTARATGAAEKPTVVRSATVAPALRRAGVAVLLAALAVQLVLPLGDMSATSDETTHLASGYSYWVHGEVRLNPQHPPLVKLLSGAAVALVGVEADWGDPAWTADPPQEWVFGERLLYANGPERLLFAARFPVVGLALLLAWIVYRWATDAFGDLAGLVALGLAAFSPNLIAHGHLVTMDVGVACFSTLFLWRLSRWAAEPTRTNVAWAGAALGLALATKFSAALLVPAGLVLATVGTEAPPARRALRGALAFGAMLAVAAAVVWASYGFPFDPSFYVDGARQVNQDHATQDRYYLFGAFSEDGFWHYFFAAFAVKTPVVTSVLILLAAVSLRRYPARRAFDEAALVFGVVAWFGVTSALANDLGVRYVLPAYPLLFVFASRFAAWLSPGPGVRTGVRAAVAGAVALFYVGSAVATYPNHLGFFNVAVGGPSRGHHYLDDSNLDWGQDLPRLARWQRERGVGRVRLLYPWSGRPEHYGIDHVRMEPRDWYGAPRPGTYVVATVWLIRGLDEAETRGTPTDWLERYEPIDRVGTSFFVYEFPGSDDRDTPGASPPANASPDGPVDPNRGLTKTQAATTSPPNAV